jgi:hypothetical protein
MMAVPERLTADWITSLDNGDLVAVESDLHTEFVDEENLERRRRGDRYVLLQGPAALVDAWLRWLMVNNETRLRSLVVRRRK